MRVRWASLAKWLCVPAGAVVAFLVFTALDGLTSPREAESGPVFVVNKVVKVFVPPPPAAPARAKVPVVAPPPPPILAPVASHPYFQNLPER